MQQIRFLVYLPPYSPLHPFIQFCPPFVPIKKEEVEGKRRRRRRRRRREEEMSPYVGEGDRIEWILDWIEAMGRREERKD
jgi:hypothetical protein